jgi:hypothetical protein
MSSKKKKKKKKKPTPKRRFKVTLTRAVEYRAEVEVVATSASEAQVLAENKADEPRANCWVEGDILDSSYDVEEIHP